MFGIGKYHIFFDISKLSTTLLSATILSCFTQHDVVIYFTLASQRLRQRKLKTYFIAQLALFPFQNITEFFPCVMDVILDQNKKDSPVVLERKQRTSPSFFSSNFPTFSKKKKSF